jgi:acetaldehyde dehydrogenase/alcohol dehydrogenase
MAEATARPAAPADVETAVDTLAAHAVKSLEEYASFTQEQVEHIVRKASPAAPAEHCELAGPAAAETGRGVFGDKAMKNLFACEHVTHSVDGLRTVGAVRRDGLNGITEIAEPVGVVCAMTPVTNPTPTTIFKALAALKTRDPIVLAFHPSAQRCSAEAARIVRDAAVAAGAPEHCVQRIEEPSMEATRRLTNYEDVSTILATGGNAMVRAAYSCGKPALGVGAGDVGGAVDVGGDVARAVHDIVLSKAFDNGMICASEQAAILDAGIYERAVAEFRGLHAHLATPEEKEKPERFLFGATARGGPTAPRRGSTPTPSAARPTGSPNRRASPCPRTPPSSSPRSAPSAPPSRSAARSSPRCWPCCARRAPSTASNWPRGWSSSTGWATAR